MPDPRPVILASPISRRGLLTGGVTFAAAVLLEGCTNSDNEPTSAAGAPRGSFPVEIEHQFGATTIPATPERVVTVGFTEQDPVLAVGVAPAGVREWYGGQPYATWPWAQDELGDATPDIVSAAEFNFEKVAESQPDLIVGTYSGMTGSDYETLSAIAPTLAQSGEYVDWAMPWQEQTLMIGRALGREDEAQRQIDGVDAKFQEARSAHPEFQGTALLVQFGEGGQYDVLSSTSPRGSFLTQLGFGVPDTIGQMLGETDEEFVPVSPERIELLEADLLVWAAAGASEQVDDLQSSTLYQGLDVVAAGHDVFIEDEVLNGALSWSTVLSIPYAIDHLVPELAAALGGSS